MRTQFVIRPKTECGLLEDIQGGAWSDGSLNPDSWCLNRRLDRGHRAAPRPARTRNAKIYLAVLNRLNRNPPNALGALDHALGATTRPATTPQALGAFDHALGETTPPATTSKALGALAVAVSENRRFSG